MRAAAVLLFAVAACEGDVWQRMEQQPKYLPYSSNPFFADDRAMRTPPPGTVSRERYAVDRLELRGEGPSQDAGYLVRSPVAFTPEVLALGRRRFEVFCAPCHGLVGDGHSIVGRNMALRVPPSLHERAAMPDGFFYDAITYGYGVMPSYSEHLNAQERWAVVGYVRALQLSQRAPLSSAPAEVRRSLEGSP